MDIKNIVGILTSKFGKDFKCEIVDWNEEIDTLITDSRNHFKKDNALFFAIKTPGGNDGHKFILDLYNRGVRNFIVEYKPDNLPEDINLFLVPNTIEALSEIGKQNRKNAKKVVAITGSRGKTTLKEIIFQLMESHFNISRSPRSFNSKIGVPLSLWQITPSTDMAVIEAGISQVGEMQRLSDSISPDIVILTNLGDAHSQGFSSDKEKATEKTKLAYNKNVKRVIYPKDNILFEESLKEISPSVEKIGWSTKDKNAHLFIIERENGIEYLWSKNRNGEREKRFIKFHIEKDYDLENISAALAFMLSEGFNPEEIEERITQLHKIKTRMNVSEGINGCSIIMDSYTSDLSSLLPAIDFATRRKMPSQTLSLIISDLKHEGKDVEKTYSEIAKIVKDTNISRFIGVGNIFALHSDLFPKNSKFYSSTEELLKNFSVSDFNDEIILIKGAPQYDFSKIYEQLEAKKHETVLEVNLDALLRNYNYFRSKVPSTTGIITMVKASGYGAGSYEIAKTLQDAGASYLAVAALDEGIDLRRNGITMPVMIMNPRSVNYKALFNNKLEPVIYSMTMLKELIIEAKEYGIGEYPVHIKLDTGMHRMGFEEKDLEELIQLLKGAQNISVATIFSHLATADCLDMDNYTFRQLERFERMSSHLISALEYDSFQDCQEGYSRDNIACVPRRKPKRHILNSAGILRFPEYHYDFVRLGIGLYGANTLPPEIEKPLAVVSTLRSVIICLREIEGDEAVGYSRKGKIEGKRKIATIPIGYADGMNRQFGNGAIKVLVNGKEAPTIGNICMDATMIDVTGIDCEEGDSVEIFGEKMSVQVLADTLNTIPYEVLTSVSPRVKRTYYRE